MIRLRSNSGGVERPKIKWYKDRGKDVESAPWYHLELQYGGKEGDRINDHHLSLAEKQAARQDVGGAGSGAVDSLDAR
jgi:hypothetical protein